MDWSGTNSRQWPQCVTTFSQTVMRENQHSSLYLEETLLINLICYYIWQEGTSTMTMDFLT